MIDRYVSPAELKRLVSALLVVLGFISLALFFGFLIVPGLRYQAHVPDTPPVQGAQGETGWLDPTAYPVMRKQVVPPLDPKTVMEPNPELLKRGQELYGSTCATCHGPAGKGDGPGAKGLTPRPRDFTVAEGWKNGSRIGGIYQTLEEGIKGSSMVAYRDIRRKDRMALVHYVRSLGTFDHGTDDPAALAALAKSFAAAGEVIPNRIPVSQAVDHVVREFHPAPARFQDHPLVRAYVIDAEKAAQTLAGIPDWQTRDAALAKGILATLPGNGFKPSVAAFRSEQWQQFREALR